MSHNPNIDKVILDLLPVNMDGVDVLDAGCGYGDIAHLILTRLKGRPRIVGCDIHRPMIEKASKTENYFLLEVADIRRLPYGLGQFYITICTDVIEHAEEEDKDDIMRSLEAVTSHMVIVSTPDGPTKQDEVDGNPFQKHRSYWTKKELESYGYVVIRVPMYPMNRITRFLRKIKPRTDHVLVGYKVLNGVQKQ